MRTIGVEEELLLVDSSTGAPVPAAPDVLATATLEAPRGFTVVAEMHEEMLELVSQPYESLRALHEGLLRARRYADDTARRLGARAAPLATSPLPCTPHPSAGARYDRIVHRYGATPLRCMTCGMHVHVSIRSPEEGVAVLDRIRVWLPVIRALTANSPFHDGADTGYASYRFLQWSQWPSSGPAEAYGDLPGYRAATAELLGTGVLLDAKMLYPDARLSERFPTVEVRVADVPLEADASVAIAGLVRGMVTTAAERAAAGEPVPSVSASAIRLASWRASLEGLEGELVHPATGSPAPAAEVVAALLEYAAPGLAAHGDLGSVRAGVDRILMGGNGAAVQRREAVALGLSEMVLAAADRARGRARPSPVTAGAA